MQDKKWQVADTMNYGILKENAKENRRYMTEAESAFWQFAKGSGLGEKCRRQYIIGNYIVDFFFRDSMFIVELDGEYHFTSEQIEEDRIRQEWLEYNGYKVMRFMNIEIFSNIDEVIKKIKAELVYGK